MGDDPTQRARAGLPRRLAALFYDLLLVVAISFVATFAMLPLTRGEAILTSTQGHIGRIYHEVRRRPHFLVERVYGESDPASAPSGDGI